MEIDVWPASRKETWAASCMAIPRISWFKVSFQISGVSVVCSLLNAFVGLSSSLLIGDRESRLAFPFLTGRCFRLILDGIVLPRQFFAWRVEPLR